MNDCLISITKNLIDSNDILRVASVLKSGKLSRGYFTEKVEKKIKAMFKVKNAILTSSGAGSLFISLKALGVKKGDEIITTPFSFMATINAILMCNAKPVLVDIDEKSFLINSRQIKKRINKETKGILLVDLFGRPCEYSLIKPIARKYGLFVLSDSCQAIGAKYNYKPLTDFADICVYSFFNSKTITSGEGGLILTNNKRLADKISMNINHGQNRGEKYAYQQMGYNFRPTDIQSALILGQLDKLLLIIKKRINNAHYLAKLLKDVPGLCLPREDCNHTYERFVIRIKKSFGVSRKIFQDSLLKKGIQVDIQYPKPLHYYSHIKDLGYKNGDFPIAEKIAGEIISLPVHSQLKIFDLNYIAKAIKRLKKC